MSFLKIFKYRFIKKQKQTKKNMHLAYFMNTVQHDEDKLKFNFFECVYAEI